MVDRGSGYPKIHGFTSLVALIVYCVCGYSSVPITRHGTFIQHTSFIGPNTFPKSEPCLIIGSDVKLEHF